MNHMINNLLTALNNVGEAFCEHAAGVFVQTAFLVILLYAVDLLLRKRVRAVFRYCVWLLVLAKLVLPPTLSLPTGVGYWAADHLPSAMNVSSRPFDAPGFEYMGTSGERPHTGPSDDVAESAPLVVAENAPLTALTWQAILFILWLVGVLAFLALLVQRARFVRGLIVASTPATAEFAGVLEQCRRRIGVRWNTSVRISDTIPSPAVCGFFRPTIVIPVTLVDKLSPDGLKAILIHELAHIKRGDLWVNSIQTFLQIAYFYNPFVWFANSIIRRVCEEAVDETVLVALGGRAKDYSNTLIDIGETAFWRAELGLRLIGVAESKKALKWRIRHMLTRPIPTSSKVGVLGTIGIIVVAAVLLPMATAEKLDERNTRTIGQDDETSAESLRQIAAQSTDRSEKLGQLLVEAVWNRDIDKARSLLSQGALASTRDKHNSTPLHIAAKVDKLDLARLLIAEGANVNARDKYQFTPLHWAAEYGHKEIVQLLIAKGADVNAKNRWNCKPADYAWWSGDRDIHSIIWAAGTTRRPNIPESELHIAAQNGQVDVAKRLIDQGVDIDIRGANDKTPLYGAIGYGHKDIVELLIAQGADVEAKNSWGGRPLAWAVRCWKKDMVELLIAKGADVNAEGGDGYTALHWAARDGLKEIAELLLANGAVTDTKEYFGCTALHKAAEHGHKDLIELLLKKGAAVDPLDDFDQTPLHVAAVTSAKDIADILVAHGADTSNVHIAAFLGDMDELKRLVQSGASPNAKDKKGHTPLRTALLGEQNGVIEYLLTHGADVNSKDNYGESLTACALWRDDRAAVELLVANGAKVSLHVAAYLGSLDKVDDFLEKDVNVNERTGRKDLTPLHAAVVGGQKKVVEFLITKGADVNAKDRGGYTPLFYAVWHNREEAAKLLLDKGADPNVRSVWNRTPLHWAVRQGGSKEMIELLVAKGADVNLKRGDATALKMAKDNGHTEIVELLRKLGAKE